jgi:predicted metal-dependent hydrolase
MALTKTIEHHPHYGDIYITVNPRARRIIMRATNGKIEVTLPPQAGKSDLFRALEKHGEKLLQQCNQETGKKITPDYKVETPGFTFTLQAGDRKEFYIRYSGTHATLLYPADTQFDTPAMQEWFGRVRITALRNIAKRELPPRLKELADKHGFRYTRVTLRDSHSRWGSCSNRASISLSIYLQLLPQHLIDYVLLHELCHTIELNHSDRFWALMDKVTDKKAKRLREQLKLHRTNF